MKNSLRPATDNDIEFIFQLRVETMKPIFKDTIGWDNIKEREKAADHLNHARIVIYDQKEIGVIKVVPGTDEMLLHQIQILPEFQGKGVGSELVRQTMLQSKKLNKPITLFVVKNTPAKRLYDQLGFFVTDDYEYNCKMRWLPDENPPEFHDVTEAGFVQI